MSAPTIALPDEARWLRILLQVHREQAIAKAQP